MSVTVIVVVIAVGIVAGDMVVVVVADVADVVDYSVDAG